MTAYFCRLRWGWEDKQVWMIVWIVHHDSLLPRQVGAPPLLEILLGRQDEWMLKERGEAALDYINFQRMFIVISVLINIFSFFAFFVNFFATTSRSGVNEDKEEFSFTPFVNRTSLSNLVEDSKWHFYHVVASSMLPYLVLITAHLFLPTCLTTGDNPESRFLTMCNKYLVFFKTPTQHSRGARSEPQGPQSNGDPKLFPAGAPPGHHQVV